MTRRWRNSGSTSTLPAITTQAQALPPIAHAFSHYKLQLQPLRWRGTALRARIGDNDDLRWVARAELSALGIPAPIRKLLEASTPEH